MRELPTDLYKFDDYTVTAIIVHINLWFNPIMSQWATMSAHDGRKEMENEMEEVTSPWFSQNGGHAADEEEIQEEMEEATTEDMEEEMVDAGFCDTCGREIYGKSSCRVCNPWPSNATDESEDPETEVHESDVHEYEIQESEVHEAMAQAELKA